MGTLYQGYAILCAGYFKLMLGLKKEEKILIPRASFDHESVRYEHRFAPFANLLTPPLMPYNQYLEVYEHVSKSSSLEIFSAASHDFARARQIFESIVVSSSSLKNGGEEFNKVASVAKNNLVVASVLSKDAARKIEFEFNQHKIFPTLKLI